MENKDQKNKNQARINLNNGALFIAFVLVFFLGLIIGMISYSKLTDRPPVDPDRFSPRLGLVQETGQPTRVSLFFSGKNGDSLHPESRIVDMPEEFNNKIKKLVEVLATGPHSDLFFPTIPEETKVLAVYLDQDNIATINFSPELAEGIPGGTTAEALAIYSITNSITANFDNIDGIKIMIGGEERETLAGQFSIADPIGRNLAWVK